MAIVGTIRPIRTKCTGVDNRGRRGYESVYEVISDDKTDGPPLIMTVSGLPQLGDFYVWYNSFDDFSFVDSYGAIDYRDFKQTQRLWTVPVIYKAATSDSSGSTRPFNNGGNPLTDYQDPRNEPWEIEGSFQQFMRPVTHDKDWHRLSNINDEPYVPALEKEDSHDTIILKKNTATISLSTRAYVRNTVNQNSMWGLQPRQIKLAEWRYRICYFSKMNIPYVANELTFKISYDKDNNDNTVGWTNVELSRGFRELVDNTATDPKLRYKEILIRDHPITKPALLDANGAILANGGTPVYDIWKIEDERDFVATIGVPDPLPGNGVFV